jgi:hypothetical protein
MMLDWDHVGSIAASSDHKVERVHCFVATRPQTALKLARGEILEAQWFDLDALPAPIGELSVRTLALLRGGDGGEAGAAMRGS